MNDFPKWKYALIAVVILLGFIYALPNVFPPVPAVQISASHEAKVDEALKEKVLGILQTKKIEFRDVQLQGERLLARFANPDLQFAGCAKANSARPTSWRRTLHPGAGLATAIGTNACARSRPAGRRALPDGVDRRRRSTRCPSAMSADSAQHCAGNLRGTVNPGRRASSSRCVRKPTARPPATSSPRK
jgi:preprotein translocase subunit SecD